MKKVLVLCFFVSLLTPALWAQPNLVEVDSASRAQAADLVTIANDAASLGLAPVDVRMQYESAAQLDPNNIEANYGAGLKYLETFDKYKATPFLLRTYELNPRYKFNLLYEIGLSYHYAGKWDEAIDYYDQYREKLKANPQYAGRDRTGITLVQKRIEECKHGQELEKKAIDYSIVSIGTTINSDGFDYAPVLNQDETLLIFTSRRNDGTNLSSDVDVDNFQFEDIYFSTRSGGDNWDYAKNIGEEINTEYHDSNLALSADGNTLYLYKDENNGDIYYSEKQPDGTWGEAIPLTAINSSYKENSVSISPDDQLLFFSSDRPSGIGGLDIYVCFRNNQGEWGRVLPLGPAVNTEWNEEGPFIDYDGKTLFFSSDGWNSMGGRDIFKTTYDSADATWTKPINLGWPLNTPDDDIYFVGTEDGKRGYYASVRQDGQGYLDIYEVSIPDDFSNGFRDIPPVARRKVNPGWDEKPPSVPTLPTGNPEAEPEQAGNPQDTVPQQEPDPVPVETEPSRDDYFTFRLKVVEDGTGKMLPNPDVSFKSFGDNVQGQVKRNADGIFVIRFRLPEAKEFVLSVNHPGYIFKNYRITFEPNDNMEASRSVALVPTNTKFPNVLRNIYFDFDKATFTRDSYQELNDLKDYLISNPTISIEIAGHTDNIGNDAYNKRLSQKRAQAVLNWLVSQGIDPSRLRAVGYGEEKPLASNDDEEAGRELNRRVEFLVLKM